jgi:hypothetical protein
MTTTRPSQEPVQDKQAVFLLPPPGDRPAWEWAEKVMTAEAARALGSQLREGKHLVFSDRHHLPG